MANGPPEYLLGPVATSIRLEREPPKSIPADPPFQLEADRDFLTFDASDLNYGLPATVSFTIQNPRRAYYAYRVYANKVPTNYDFDNFKYKLLRVDPREVTGYLAPWQTATFEVLLLRLVPLNEQIGAHVVIEHIRCEKSHKQWNADLWNDGRLADGVMKMPFAIKGYMNMTGNQDDLFTQVVIKGGHGIRQLSVRPPGVLRHIARPQPISNEQNEPPFGLELTRQVASFFWYEDRDVSCTLKVVNNTSHYQAVQVQSEVVAVADRNRKYRIDATRLHLGFLTQRGFDAAYALLPPGVGHTFTLNLLACDEIPAPSDDCFIVRHVEVTEQAADRLKYWDDHREFWADANLVVDGVKRLPVLVEGEWQKVR